MSLINAKKTRRKQILRAAERLFARWGYHSTEVEQIAKMAGISKGAIYNHFISKEDVLLSIMEERLSELDAQMEAGLAEIADAILKLKKGIEIYIRFLEKHSALFKILTGEHVRFSVELKKRYYETIFSRLHHFENSIKVAISRGQLKTVDPFIAVTCLIGMIDFLTLRELFEGRNLTLKYKAKHVTKLFLEGMLP